MKDALDRSLGLEKLELVTDARAALTGALDGKPGVIVIAGTGSIALGLNEAGGDARSGGWGPTFSDEGSGYDIARQALKAVAASFDGRSSETLLTKMICKELGIEKPSDLPSVIYSEDAKPAQIASLAKLVSQAAAARRRSGAGDFGARRSRTRSIGWSLSLKGWPCNNRRFVWLASAASSIQATSF